MIWLLHFIFCLELTFCKYFFFFISLLMACFLPFCVYIYMCMYICVYICTHIYTYTYALVRADLPLLLRYSTQRFNSFPYLFLDFTFSVRSIRNMNPVHVHDLHPQIKVVIKFTLIQFAYKPIAFSRHTHRSSVSCVQHLLTQ